MTLCKIDTFKDIITPLKNRRLIGLDVGKKTIGLATCDQDWKVATPHSILWRQKFTLDMDTLFGLIDDEGNIGGMVVGWPLNMDGTAGARCDSVRDFTHAMLRLRDFPVLFQDERLSTKAVERPMVDADMTRQKRHLRRDALAATWILQSALDVMSP
ncbi:MAG: Holliday junction resolvase RuvX [Candidatus Puniceispirillales bacterium WSBS_2018_MAG_OTU23]